MKRFLAILAAVAATTAARAQQTPPPVDIDAMKGFLAGALGDQMKGGPVVDFRELKALLPESLPGLKRAEAAGEKRSVMGMTVATAEASYRSDAGAGIEIRIVDFGGAGVYKMAQAAWASMEVDRESDSGYEKTFDHKGSKGLEKYDRTARKGEIQLLVAGRYHVEIAGRNVDIKDIQAVLEKIDLAKLAALKPAAPPAAPAR
jgi:opacity protein-like surface antigen